jgi:glycosyltransferase involved in cell wall biosynthesis|tara:strand:+ start:1173 stop:1862 length:690 start_codon:yes stop_codon:yes gene_type:complete
MKKILVGTPAHDGRVEVHYVNSLMQTIDYMRTKMYDVHPVFMSYDSLLQRARNDIVKIAVEQNYDYLFFIDSDMVWDPEWMLDLILTDVDVISATARKKTDDELQFAIKIKSDFENAKRLPENPDVMEVAGTGMAFTKLTNKAFTSVWNVSKPYKNGDREGRMVFDIGIDDEGELYSEDTAFCNKWESMGGTTWVNISMTCGHIGSKVFTGNFKQFFEEYVNRYGKNKK